MNQGKDKDNKKLQKYRNFASINLNAVPMSKLWYSPMLQQILKLT